VKDRLCVVVRGGVDRGRGPVAACDSRRSEAVKDRRWACRLVDWLQWYSGDSMRVGLVSPFLPSAVCRLDRLVTR
jgi:hypothetical protein